MIVDDPILGRVEFVGLDVDLAVDPADLDLGPWWVRGWFEEVSDFGRRYARAVEIVHAESHVVLRRALGFVLDLRLEGGVILTSLCAEQARRWLLGELAATVAHGGPFLAEWQWQGSGQARYQFHWIEVRPA